MAIYVQASDVQDRYLGGTIPEAWLETQIEDAEDLLFGYFPNLATDATESQQRRIKKVVAAAIIRLYDNPRGIYREQIEEQSFTKSSGQSDSEYSGRLFFRKNELDEFRTARRTWGVIGIAGSPFSGYGVE